MRTESPSKNSDIEHSRLETGGANSRFGAHERSFSTPGTDEPHSKRRKCRTLFQKTETADSNRDRLADEAVNIELVSGPRLPHTAILNGNFAHSNADPCWRTENDHDPPRHARTIPVASAAGILLALVAISQPEPSLIVFYRRQVAQHPTPEGERARQDERVGELGRLIVAGAQTGAIENGFAYLPKENPWLSEYL